MFSLGNKLASFMNNIFSFPSSTHETSIGKKKEECIYVLKNMGDHASSIKHMWRGGQTKKIISKRVHFRSNPIVIYNHALDSSFVFAPYWTWQNVLDRYKERKKKVLMMMKHVKPKCLSFPDSFGTVRIKRIINESFVTHTFDSYHVLFFVVPRQRMI